MILHINMENKPLRLIWSSISRGCIHNPKEGTGAECLWNLTWGSYGTAAKSVKLTADQLWLNSYECTEYMYKPLAHGDIWQLSN